MYFFTQSIARIELKIRYLRESIPVLSQLSVRMLPLGMHLKLGAEEEASRSPTDLGDSGRGGIRVI